MQSKSVALKASAKGLTGLNGAPLINSSCLDKTMRVRRMAKPPFNVQVDLSPTSWPSISTAAAAATSTRAQQRSVQVRFQSRVTIKHNLRTILYTLLRDCDGLGHFAYPAAHLAGAIPAGLCGTEPARTRG